MRGPPTPFLFFFNDTATTEIYTLSLHDALPICASAGTSCRSRRARGPLLPCQSPSALDTRPLVLDRKHPCCEARGLDRIIRLDRVPLHVAAGALGSGGARVRVLHHRARPPPPPPPPPAPPPHPSPPTAAYRPA